MRLTSEKERAAKVYTNRMKPIADEARNIEKLTTLLKNPNSLSSAALQTQISRTIAGETGPIATRDIDRLGMKSAPDTVARWNNWLSGDVNVTLTPQEIGAIKQIMDNKRADALARFQEEKAKAKAAARKTAGLHSKYGRSDELDSILDDSTYTGIEDMGGVDQKAALVGTLIQAIKGRK